MIVVGETLKPSLQGKADVGLIPRLGVYIRIFPSLYLHKGCLVKYVSRTTYPAWEYMMFSCCLDSWKTGVIVRKGFRRIFKKTIVLFGHYTCITKMYTAAQHLKYKYEK
jgi:hypothetical protein